MRKITNQDLIKVFLQCDDVVSRDKDGTINTIQDMREYCDAIVEMYGIESNPEFHQHEQFTAAGVCESECWNSVIEIEEADIVFDKASDKLILELFQELILELFGVLPSYKKMMKMSDYS